MADPLLASGISQRFGERVVLDGVDLEVPAGRVIGLLGPERCRQDHAHAHPLRRARRPTPARCAGGGRAATDADRRSWGYMPQERGLYRDMRVLDLLAWIARLHGLDKATGAASAQDLLERLGLGDRGRDKVQDLSGGMAQRVQLAAAMVHDPEVLVLDEPFAGLDPGAIEFLSGVILDHVRRGRVLLFSSHQLDLVEDLCETITLINHGRVVLHGDVRRLKAASPDRFLRVDVDVPDGWVEPLRRRGVRRDASGTRLRLHPGSRCRHGARPRAGARRRRRLRRGGTEPVRAVPGGRRRAGGAARRSRWGPSDDGPQGAVARRRPGAPRGLAAASPSGSSSA